METKFCELSAQSNLRPIRDVNSMVTTSTGNSIRPPVSQMPVGPSINRDPIIQANDDWNGVEHPDHREQILEVNVDQTFEDWEVENTEGVDENVSFVVVPDGVSLENFVSQNYALEVYEQPNASTNVQPAATPRNVDPGLRPSHTAHTNVQPAATSRNVDPGLRPSHTAHTNVQPATVRRNVRRGRRGRRPVRPARSLTDVVRSSRSLTDVVRPRANMTNERANEEMYKFYVQALL